MRRRWWRALGLFAASVALVCAAAVAWRGETNPAEGVPALNGDVNAELAAIQTASPLDTADPDTALAEALADPALATDLAAAAPDPADGSLSNALTALATTAADLDPADVGGFFDELGTENTARLSVLYPSVIAHLPGAPFDARISANRILVAAAAEASTSFDGPPRPWQAAERPAREELAELLGTDRQFLYFDAYGNDGEGAWVEVLGDLDSAESVAVLVPGGSATVASDNFDLYHERATSFVDAADTELAIVVWAGAAWPTGWIEESWASWSEIAADDLASFTIDLRSQIGTGVPITLAGHSYGGAIVGLAETRQMEADRVLHIASAGMGHGVSDPGDYTEPCRERYSITAPGDPISYVQGLPYAPLLGHGADPDEFAGMVNLYSGYLSDSPDAVDDHGLSLVERGISGKQVEGRHSHSEIFYMESDAWRNLLAVVTGDEATPAAEQPRAWSDC